MQSLYQILDAKREEFMAEMARECEYSLGRAQESALRNYPCPWKARAESASRLAFAVARESAAS
jgi:hypothetical protein